MSVRVGGGMFASLPPRLGDEEMMTLLTVHPPCGNESAAPGECGDCASTGSAGSAMSDDDWELLSEQERALSADGEDESSDVGEEEGEAHDEASIDALGGRSEREEDAAMGWTRHEEHTILDDDGTLVTLAERAALATFIDETAATEDEDNGGDDDGDDEV